MKTNGAVCSDPVDYPARPYPFQDRAPAQAVRA